jgi:hypothetical protein
MDNNDCKPPLRFNGKLGNGVVRLGPSQMAPEDHKAADKMKQNMNN